MLGNKHLVLACYFETEETGTPVVKGGWMVEQETAVGGPVFKIAPHQSSVSCLEPPSLVKLTSIWVKTLSSPCSKCLMVRCMSDWVGWTSPPWVLGCGPKHDWGWGRIECHDLWYTTLIPAEQALLSQHYSRPQDYTVISHSTTGGLKTTQLRVTGLRCGCLLPVNQRMCCRPVYE